MEDKNIDRLLSAIVLFLIIIAFAVIVIVNVMKERKSKKDGDWPVIDLADFEYDSKKQIFRKKDKVNDDPFDATTDPAYNNIPDNCNYDD